jgi:hypothetical protein
VAYDEKLADRVRALLSQRSDVREQKMFGGLTFMVAHHMCCGIDGDELIVRLNPDREPDALARPHARKMDLIAELGIIVGAAVTWTPIMRRPPGSVTAGCDSEVAPCTAT